MTRNDTERIVKDLNMTTRTIVVALAGWFGACGLLAWRVVEHWQTWKQSQAVLETLPSPLEDLVGDVRVYEVTPTWRLYAFVDVRTKREINYVVETGEGIVLMARSLDKPGSLLVSVYRESSAGRFEPLVDVGAVEPGGFPGFVGYTPAAGPDRGVFLGDYDLDGTFERRVRWKLPWNGPDPGDD